MLLSSYVPVALNACVVPGAMETVPGVIASETKLGFTVKVVEPLIEFSVAVMVVEPAAFAVTSPPLATVATLVADELQVTVLVTSETLPSLKVPVAVNGAVALVWSEEPAGPTLMDLSLG